MPGRITSRVRGLLGRGDWIYMLSLLLPLVVYNVVLKVIRVAALEDTPGPFGFLDQIRSDLLFNLGYVALWVGLFIVFRKGAPRWTVLLLFHVATLLVVLLSTSAHFYYETTGSPLRLEVIGLTLSSFGEIKGVIASEAQPWMIWLLSAVLFYVIAGPAIVTRLLQRDWYLPTWTAKRPALTRVAVFAAAFVLAGLSVIPSITGASSSFARDALVNMFVTEVEKANYADVKPDTSKVLAAGKPPTQTDLRGQGSKRNVVMIYLESTRARSTTPYSERQQKLPPQEQITPFLQQLSKNSLMAENFNAVVPHTSKSLTASHCGIDPPMDQDNSESDKDSLPSNCLPGLLGQKGYKTAYFQSATGEFERRGELVDNFGYDEFYPLEAFPKEGYDEVNYFGYEDDIMLNPSRQWLTNNGVQGDQPFLASYLTVGTHHDYGVAQDFEKKQYAKDEDLNNYLNAMRYEDQFVQKLFQQYKDLGLYENTVFIVVGDHGEAFNEHGRSQHDNVPYSEGTRVPFFVHDPQNPQPRRYEALANHTDILPTVVDLLGYKVEGGKYPGVSLLGPERDNRTHRTSCYQPFTCLMSIKDGEKYIYNYNNEKDEYYDLSKDPRERNNLIDSQNPEKIQRRRDDLLSWRAGVDKVYEDYRDRLERTTGATTTGPSLEP
jgi:phosphoglycerol transferase MdoB-like AlkP superfamily enzyme